MKATRVVTWQTPFRAKKRKKMKTEMEKQGLKLVYQDADFRKYAPEYAKNERGQVVKMVLCEELDPESGRWEPFYLIF